MRKTGFILLTVMVFSALCHAGTVTLIQDKDGYTGCYTDTYYNYDHWDKRHLFQQWLNYPSFATNKSFALNNGTTIADVADYCC